MANGVPTVSQLVQKLKNYRNVLHDDGMSRTGHVPSS